MTEPYQHIGFERCHFGPDECDGCHNHRPLFFGDKNYWDSREGSYYCAECLDERIAHDEESIQERKQRT